MVQIIKRAKYLIKFLLWYLSGYISRQISINSPQKVTLLLTFYNPIRMKYINSQIRNILKCTFIEKLVISNHNPTITIEEKINIIDDRLVVINQKIRRGCGYRWQIIKTLSADFVISIDDDILLFPMQLKTLFQNLLREPEIPHGFSGFIRLENEELQYRERENIEVHYLCEVYAVSRKHIERYIEMEKFLSEIERSLVNLIESYHDFIVISQTGTRNPKIHKVGTIFRSETFMTPGVALHKDKEWVDSVSAVSRAVQELRSQNRA